MAAYVRDHPVDIRLIEDGRKRGFALEDQLFNFLNPINQLVSAKLLDGTDGPAVHFSCNYAVPFKSLEEVVLKDVPVLYLPDSITYACDGILMPAAGDADGEIILVECSTEDPSSDKRVDKVLKWYRPGPKKTREGDPVATVLKGRYPNRPLLVALCYDKELAQATDPLDVAAASLSRGEWHDDASISKGTAPVGCGGTGAVVRSAPARQVPAAPAIRTVGSQVRVLDAPRLRTLGLVL
jgi:hypothetical protein